MARYFESLDDFRYSEFHLHSRIAEENGDFTISDVIRTVNEKMISRHPHVFASLELKNSEAVLHHWETIKKTEKGEISLAQKLEKLPRSIPATMRAQEVVKKAQAYGHSKPDGEELAKRLRGLLEGMGPQSEQELADLAFYTVLLLDFHGYQSESLLSQRVDHEIENILKIDEKRN